MSEKNLVPVPDPSDRRAAARRARMERRQRALAEQKSGPVAAPREDGGETHVATARAKPVDMLRPDAFVLPPRAKAERRSTRFGQFIKLSFLVVVVAPTIVAALFYAFVATDQYATNSAFAVRSASSTGPALDTGSMMSLGGLAAASPEISDSFIVQEYIGSREMVETLIAEANFIEIYSRPSADGYYRLDPEATIEDMVDYWQMMNTVDYDTDTGILNMVVRAFRPQDAETITRKVVEQAELLVNDLSQRAREDSVASAKREVDIAEERYAAARTALAGYRGERKEIDPTATATARQTLVGELEGQLAGKESELSALRATMSENAPRVQVVQNEITALERQIAVERLSVAVAEQGDTEPVLTERLSQFEELLAERDFSEKAYVSALAMLESARMEALKQQRYLAVFVRGAAPQMATYPKGIRWTLILFGVLLAGWGLASLISAAIRDRMA